ncbi:MAG: tyrosine-type recombinase/integrase [Solirubrobacteraceae bacterium]
MTRSPPGSNADPHAPTSAARVAAENRTSACAAGRPQGHPDRRPLRAARPRTADPRTSLHHIFCTILAESGEPIEVIREFVGHADIRTTTIYTDVSPERLQSAIDIANDAEASAVSGRHPEHRAAAHSRVAVSASIDALADRPRTGES